MHNNIMNINYVDFVLWGWVVFSVSENTPDILACIKNIRKIGADFSLNVINVIFCYN